MNHTYHLASMKQDNEIKKTEVGNVHVFFTYSKFHISQSHPNISTLKYSQFTLLADLLSLHSPPLTSRTSLLERCLQTLLLTLLDPG